MKRTIVCTFPLGTRRKAQKTALKHPDNQYLFGMKRKGTEKLSKNSATNYTIHKIGQLGALNIRPYYQAASLMQ